MDVEWIILAESAEVLNNKLYLMGGGWDALTVNSGFPLQYPCAIAAAFSVPWNETNQVYNIELQIVDEDERHVAATIGGQVEAGRPPGIRPGQTQRVQLVVRLALGIEKPGGYVIKASIEGEERRRIGFNVAAGPNIRPPAPLAVQGEPPA